jgi:acyl-CoA thioesterase FadM
VHVFVDRATRKPRPIGEAMRAALQTLMTDAVVS